jgi:hypothetical protein
MTKGPKSGWFLWIVDHGFALLLVFLLALFAALIVFTLLVDRRLDDLEGQLTYVDPDTGDRLERVAPPGEVAVGQTLYVPAYSHIYHEGGKPLLLECTISIRNTDPGQAIVLNEVRYHDSDGNLVKAYLDHPVRLGPLASAEFLVEQQDTRGGAGANFIVGWTSEALVNEPIVEAVMVGTMKGQAVSFVRSAQVIAHYPAHSGR